MSGQAMPMSVNEYVIRPLLSNISVVGLFFIPMITMRLFAEEKRSGTIELLATSPIRDIEIIIGKWLAAVILYACLLLFTRHQFRVPVPLRQSRLEAAGHRLPGLAAAGRRIAGRSERLFPRSPKIRSSRAPPLSACACCSGFSNGCPGMKPRPGRRCSRTCRWSRISIRFRRACWTPRTPSFMFPLIFLGLFLTSRSMESLRWRS